MTNEERKILSQFLEQLAAVQGVNRDPEADRLIADAVARQPDAAYLLVQKALLQEQALNGAKARIDQLQAQLEQTRSAAKPARGGFLGNDPWAAPSRPAAAPAAPAAPMPGAWPGAAPAAGFGGGMGSFLGTAAATAAGIAGGAFLFHGIENMLGHHGGNGFLDSAATGNDPIENVTINEYYGSDHGFADADDDGADRDLQNADFQLDDDGYDAYDDDDSLSI